MNAQRTASHPVSGWVVGFATLAGLVMLLNGFWEVFAGIAILLNPDFFVVGHHYIFSLDATTWGWIHLILGAIMALAGMAVFSGQGWARGVGIILAFLSAIANFLYIPYYPIWSLLLIILDFYVIGALVKYNPEAASDLQ